jgi:hypothetical protein
VAGYRRNRKRLILYDNLADAFSINHVKKFRVTDFFFGLRPLLEKIGEKNYYQCDNNKKNQMLIRSIQELRPRVMSLIDLPIFKNF